ncbi:hypothetical protein FXB42_13885 [Acetobacterium wieringae]|uniref:Transposase n=1 Tax=Acetobacterium wieringae TaxID=52694 RepID=A0A5D0WIH8_9FIRM|nr:hypothetical protein FXB42_13885 [Acetobacterium wieringae]
MESENEKQLLIVNTVQNKKYNSYKGEIGSEVANVIDRNFHADKPNTKWLTDITEFLDEGKGAIPFL